MEWSGFVDDGFVAPPTISADELRVGRYRGKDAGTDMVTVRWFVGVAVLDRQSPHLRAAQSQPYRAFWEDPATIHDIFGPPEPWAPLAMARFERAFRDRHQ